MHNEKKRILLAPFKIIAASVFAYIYLSIIENSMSRVVLETISITDKSCPATEPEQSTCKLKQPQEVPGMLVVSNEQRATF
jgi:hypothetical protein